MPSFRIYTIGYGGRTIDEIVSQLNEKGVHFVIDVRSFPSSRYQPDFSRVPLSISLRDAGIGYGFMGKELGGRPDDDSCYDNNHVKYMKVRAKRFFQEGIARLHTACERGYIVCLMCAEAKPEQCHRSGMIGEALAEEGIEVEHLLNDGRSMSQEKVMNIRTGGQEELFDDVPWRKDLSI